MDIIDTILNRGVAKIYPSKEALEKTLRSGKKLKLYQGFDPTGIQLHIGHLIGLRKLRHFQQAGHEVIFLIGDGTGQAGDPSGKTRTREKFLTNKDLKQNAKDYVMQADRILDFKGKNPVKILYNGDWLNKLTLTDILFIAQHFSAQQLLERDMFQDRIKRGESINLREFLYPLLQAYDSVFMDVDLEIGGEDQTFNMLCGRDLIKSIKNKDKFVLTTPLLTDTTGKKIGKTEGNVIALNDNPINLFGKIMSLPDEIIIRGLEYLTDFPITQLKTIQTNIEGGDNPFKYKKLLAFEIIKELNDIKTAEDAQRYFEQAHQKKETPDKIENVVADNIPIIDFLVKVKISQSKSEAKRLIKQKAIDINNQTITDTNIILNSNDVIKIGKHKILKIA